MKIKNYHRTFLLIMLLITSLSGYSQIEINGIYYQFNSEKKEAKVTFHNKPPYRKYRGEISIPPTISYNDTLYTVTKIGYRAFCGCSLLTSVSIPNTVRVLDEEAFWDCEELATITMPGSITSIGKRAFYNCTALESVSIQEGVTNIESYAFASCHHLMSVTLPETLTNISDHAFSGCSSLPTIILPKNLRSIGKGAFWECISLTSITALSKTPPKISEYTFHFYHDLLVAKGCETKYKHSKHWKNFKISQM